MTNFRGRGKGRGVTAAFALMQPRPMLEMQSPGEPGRWKTDLVLSIRRSAPERAGAFTRMLPEGSEEKRRGGKEFRPVLKPVLVSAGKSVLAAAEDGEATQSGEGKGGGFGNRNGERGDRFP